MLQSKKHCRHQEPRVETVKAVVHSQQKFPEKIETFEHPAVCLLAAASYCSFMYTPCQEGACMKTEETNRGMAKAAGVWGFKKCFIEGANFLS